MNRASSAVFHFWAEFVFTHPVDEVWIECKNRRKQNWGPD